MARATPLPEQLRYLQPFRSKFAPRPEILNEDSGIEPLLALLRKRIQNLSIAEAGKVLEEDLVALKDWLAKPEQTNDCLHFAVGIFLVATPADWAKQILEEPNKPPEPKLLLHVDLPEGAKRRREGLTDDGMLVSLKGLLIAISALQEEPFANLGKAYAKDEPRVTKSITFVSFGGAKGTKIVVIGETWRGPVKETFYFLNVPGGQVMASASAHSKKLDELNWDDSIVESFLHTLRVGVKTPTAT